MAENDQTRPLPAQGPAGGAAPTVAPSGPASAGADPSGAAGATVPPAPAAPPRVDPPMGTPARFTDKLWSLRSMLAVALASLIVGGIGGAGIAAAVEHGNDNGSRFGNFRRGFPGGGFPGGGFPGGGGFSPRFGQGNGSNGSTTPNGSIQNPGTSQNPGVSG